MHFFEVYCAAFGRLDRSFFVQQATPVLPRGLFVY
jgi:hypothetical protein